MADLTIVLKVELEDDEVGETLPETTARVVRSEQGDGDQPMVILVRIGR